MSKIYNQDTSILGKLTINPSNEITSKVLTLNTSNEVTYRTVDELSADMGADKTFIYSHGAASTVWTIAHNLNKKVSVTVVDSTQRVVVGQIEYIDNNNITITFNASFTGEAYIN